MGFKEDFEKLKNTWSKLSIEWKIILSTMTLMQVLSVSSIADSVYKFKGFILDGIEVYRMLTEPLFIFIHFLGVPSFERWMLDSVIWLSLYFVSLWRSSRFVRNKRNMFIFALSAVMGMFGVLFYHGSFSDKTAIHILIVLSAIIFTISYIQKTFVPTVVYAIPFFLASLFAGVSEGLFRA